MRNKANVRIVMQTLAKMAMTLRKVWTAAHIMRKNAIMDAQTAAASPIRIPDARRMPAKIARLFCFVLAGNIRKFHVITAAVRVRRGAKARVTTMNAQWMSAKIAQS
jgi:hypothetical protein